MLNVKVKLTNVQNVPKVIIKKEQLDQIVILFVKNALEIANIVITQAENAPNALIHFISLPMENVKNVSLHVTTVLVRNQLVHLALKGIFMMDIMDVQNVIHLVSVVKQQQRNALHVFLVII